MTLFLSEGFERFDFVSADEENFPRLDLPYKLGTDEVKSSGFGGDHRCILKLTEDQGSKAKRVSGCNQFIFCHDDQ